MSEDKKVYTFKVEEIFEDIPNDPQNLLMNIPPEIVEQMGWQPGDNLKILWGDQGTIVIEKIDEEESNGEG